MSSVNPQSSSQSVPAAVQGVAGACRAGLAASVRALAFWVAILLPLVYLPATISGIVSHDPVVLVGLLLVNLACAVVGHNHTPRA